MSEVSLSRPEFYNNRELSWLEFNKRVLALATDETIPLLERLKFLCISSTNLDEFFEIRVARLKQQVQLNAVQTEVDGMTPLDQLKNIGEVAHAFVDEQYRVLNDVLIPQLADEGIRFVRRTHWNKRQQAWVKEYFEQKVLPLLTPLGIDPAHPFPRVLNKSLNFVVSLEGKDAFGRSSGMAVVQAPRSLPRLIPMPDTVTDGKYDFVFLTSVIHTHVGELFAGMSVTGCHQFRLTRNSELYVDEEDIDDLLIALEDELYTRNFGDGVRLEVADNCPLDTARLLLRQVRLTEADLYQVNGPVNLNRLMTLHSAVDRADLKYQSFVPGFPKPDLRQGDIFESIRQGNILMHHPYQAFMPVIDFVRQAAADPAVLAIKQTLYRTDPDSPLPAALEDAARSGKEVTAVIELRARFDEAYNIQIANRLQDAGAHVVYGIIGHKTHAKMCMVVRQEDDGLRRYIHLSTGNYHPKTARIYTDFGLFSCDEEICKDVHKLFQQLTGLGSALKLKRLLQAPFSLHKTLLKMIRREAKHALEGRPGRIIAKVNAVTEPKLIRALYKASQAGVQIDLIVRGICCLRPGIAGVSENIRVRSVLGRFLEHSRVYYFQNDGKDEIYCASADWMHRNMLRRIEVAFPVRDEVLAARVLREGLQIHLEDNTFSWVLNADATYTRLVPTEEQKPLTSQRVLLKELGDAIELR
ncbi:MAG: polyphosphate kinase 1 [Bradymonadaceae bacterium]|nr:polyphosphate kinase 1 [Lujinxingiaceae bacterium]